MQDETYRWWPLTGSGLDHFGVDGQPVRTAVPTPAAGETLVRVEAATVCASDAKMIRLGAEHPLLRGRDLAVEPASLGHEVAVRVERSRAGLPGIADGVRLGIQPDLYNDGVRRCIGIDRPGGFADVMLLGPEIAETDYGVMAFPVPAAVGRAATAMLEPLACVEGAFRLWGRTRLRAGGRLAVLCADADADWRLALPEAPGEIDLLGIDPTRFRTVATGIAGATVAAVEDPYPRYDDVIVLGAAETARIADLVQRIDDGGTFTWLAPTPVPDDVPTDLAHFHYGKLTIRGAASTDLADATAVPVRTDYRPGGHALVFGASGPMGRFHLTRAIGTPAGPSVIVAVARRRDKLDALVRDLVPMAAARGRRVVAVATEEDGWDGALRTLAGGRGFDDVVVVAPGAEAFDRAVPHLADGGLLVGFAGTRKGEIARLPLGRVARHGVALTASSGSTIADQRVVVEKIVRGDLVPERHVAAVTGLGDLHAAMQAVMDARFGGKILVLPAVDWPLTPLADLFAARPDLAALADDGRYWSLAIEDALLGPREPPRGGASPSGSTV